MAKRFTDTDKWKKPWFRKLSPELKIFWQYMLDNCDNAGIWDVDFELASMFIGADILPDKVEKDFAKQIMIFDQGRRWFILDFIEFQYKCSITELNSKNKAHLSVINILEKYSIIDKIKGLQRGLEGAYMRGSEASQDKDTDKDKEKDKDKDKKGVQGENEDVQDPDDLPLPLVTEATTAGLDSKVSKLWISCFSRNPNIPEREKTVELILKFGDEKVYKLFKDAALRGIKTLQYIIDNMDENGNLIPYQEKVKKYEGSNSNRPGANSVRGIVTQDEIADGLKEWFGSD